MAQKSLPASSLATLLETPLETPDPPSPCIKICQLDDQKRYCIGCFRTIDEIGGWSTYSAAQKHHVLSQLEPRRQVHSCAASTSSPSS